MSSSEEIRKRAAERRRLIEAAQAADRRETNADRLRAASDTPASRRPEAPRPSGKR